MIKLSWDLWLEGEIHGGIITAGSRLVNDEGVAVAQLKKDLNSERAHAHGIHEQDVEFFRP